METKLTSHVTWPLLKVFRNTDYQIFRLMRYKILSILLAFMAISSVGLAQEICDNGIDDDGDGFIDCFDPDCAFNSACDDAYTGNDANCEVVPSAFPDFTMTLDFSTPNETTNHLGRIAIGDLDRDGIPEFISNNRYTDRVYILNGDDGTIKFQANVDYEPRWELAIANLQDDNCAEIFVHGRSGGNNIIVAYDCELNEIWRDNLRGDPGMIGLADFNQDGNTELYIRNEIRDAATGNIIIAGNDWGNANGGPVAVDIAGGRCTGTCPWWCPL